MNSLFGKTKLTLTAYSIIVAVFLAGCGGGGSGGSAAPAATSATISGSVVKGPVTGATVTFFSLNANGSKAVQLGTTTTDTSGNYTITLIPAPTTPILVETSGGSYVDEATVATTTLLAADKLQAVLPAGTVRATVTPLTYIAAARAQALAAGGTPLATAVDSSNTGVATQYGIANIITTLPPAANNATSVATTTRDERIYALVLAGIAQQASGAGVRAIDLAAALAEDAKDGLFDGTNGTTAINVNTIAGSSIALPTTAATADMQTAINAFIASPNNQTSLTQVNIPLTPVNLGVNTAGVLYTSLPVLPAAVSGQAYTATLTATGGTPPYTCALKSGSLPSGYALVPGACQITGTAGTVAGDTFSTPFVITLTDSAMPANTVDFAPLYLTTTLAAPVIAFPAQPAISEGTGGSFTVTATPASPYNYFKFDSFLNGAPPLGTTIDLAGNVTMPASVKAGTYSFGVCVVDIGGRSSCATITITVTYKGTLSGSYSGSGTGITVSGSFSIAITDGVITGSYSGTVTSTSPPGTSTVSGTVTGAVDATGNFSAASGGASGGAWTGTITKSGTALSGNGSWTGTSSSGSWSGSGTSQ